MPQTLGQERDVTSLGSIPLIVVIPTAPDDKTRRGSYGPLPENRSGDGVDLVCDNTDFDFIMKDQSIYM
jgi:hypothetical protein